MDKKDPQKSSELFLYVRKKQKTPKYYTLRIYNHWNQKQCIFLKSVSFPCCLEVSILSHFTAHITTTLSSSSCISKWISAKSQLRNVWQIPSFPLPSEKTAKGKSSFAQNPYKKRLCSQPHCLKKNWFRPKSHYTQILTYKAITEVELKLV